ncbi:hypothetical protein FQN53_003007 [Emmonsiellopsis sp. PD_33]|nr:hypothetical protein FQN53_003007 [Emmonsiellopsis sp. PD_33]
MAQALDFCLRCNSLKCRATLNERAVVTTCSHIFCLRCADHLGLSQSTGADRQCPACQASLLNPDDAVSTILNPTEDYKTSVLSGLDPSTIMECAGRAMAFWTYQTTQEIFYQEYLGKSLTDKYGALNQQMDKVIHDANSEISNLQSRISEMQMSQDQLQKKNHELVELYREKSKKHAQTTNLYNLLKTRAMRSQIQTAASDSVSQVLESFVAAPRSHSSAENDLYRPMTSLAPSPMRSPARYPTNNSGVEQLHPHQRSGSGSGSGSGTKNPLDYAAMPPPSGLSRGFRPGNIPPATPQHRTRLPGPPLSSHRTSYPERQHTLMPSNPVSPRLQRRSPDKMESRFSHNQNNVNNYGLSSGIKIGRPSDPDPRGGSMFSRENAMNNSNSRL